MIPKENVKELTGIFRQFHWLIFVPFMLFYGSTVYKIYCQKLDKELIETIVWNDAAKINELWTHFFEQDSFLVHKDHRDSSLYASFYPSLLELSNLPSDKSEHWENELNHVVLMHDSIFEAFGVELNPAYQWVKEYQKWIRIGNENAILRPFVIKTLNEQIMEFLYSRIFYVGSFCGGPYFDPVIQKFGDNYYLYPEPVDRYRLNRTVLKVNGKRIDDHTYVFKPEHQGTHLLNIEYTFWGTYGPLTKYVTKSLMVKDNELK
ncbi:MAG: hypothetical protein AAGA77_15390 [Bacteroidota bacterium]